MHPVLLARPTEHIVTFYRSDDFVVEQVASFISEGLAANEHVIAIATIRHWNAITGRLEESGIAYGRATSAGQLVFVEADEALDAVTVDGEVSVDRFRAMLTPLLKPATRTRITERYRNTSLRNWFNDLPAQDAPRCDSVNASTRGPF